MGSADQRSGANESGEGALARIAPGQLGRQRVLARGEIRVLFVLRVPGICPVQELAGEREGRAGSAAPAWSLQEGDASKARHAGRPADTKGVPVFRFKLAPIVGAEDTQLF